MKNAMKAMVIGIFVLIPMVFANYVNAQTQTKRPDVIIDSNCHGYLEYLPQGYYDDNQKYPLLIFFMGIGSTGSGSSTDLDKFFGTGGGFIQDQVQAGTFPTSFSVNGQTHKFIIITPQFITPFWQRTPTPDEVNDVINFSIANYRVDTSRIYLTGNSSGGGPVWDYVGANSTYANRIAAIVPFCGVVYPTQSKANAIKFSNVAVWAFHNKYDDGVPYTLTTEMDSMINLPPAPTPMAKQTIFPDSGHACWFGPYMRTYTEDGLNIYQWMLQYQRLVTPVNAGPDQEITLPVNSVQLNGGGKGPNGTVASYKWEIAYGPAGASFSNATIANPKLNDLKEGNYIIKLTITDNSGASASDQLGIAVDPARLRIQAVDYKSMSGVSTMSTTDDGGGTALTQINTGDWMKYSFYIPSSGLRMVSFRVGAFYDKQQFQVTDASGTIISTVDIPPTGSWDSYLTVVQNINFPTAGLQTIKLQSTTADPSQEWYIHYFDVVGASTGTPLPVNFVTFTASCSGNGIDLLWKTAQEQNSKNFTVEKSSDAINWNVIGTVPAAGQSSVELSYSFKDNLGGSGSMYRIAEYDLDGRKLVSSVIKTNCQEKQAITVYPNPVMNNAVMTINLDQSTPLYLTIIDNNGAVVRQQSNMLPSGYSQVVVEMAGLAKGTYTLQARWGDNTRNIKLVKL